MKTTLAPWTLILCLLQAPLFAAEDPLPAKVKAAEKSLLTLDCPFLVQVYDPKDFSRSQVGFCIHTNKETRGIFALSGCVGVLVEADSRIMSPFYGNRGHWGFENPCTKEGILKKLGSPDLQKTVNPVTALRIKRQEGQQVRLLRDEFGIWETFSRLIDPEKK